MESQMHRIKEGIRKRVQKAVLKSLERISAVSTTPSLSLHCTDVVDENAHSVLEHVGFRILLGGFADGTGLDADGMAHDLEHSLRGEAIAAELNPRTAGNTVGIDATNQSGDTSLHQAVRNGNVRIVETLLNVGADPDSPGGLEGLLRPLQIAASVGDVRMMQVLLQRKAQVDSVDFLNWTALHHACQAGDLEAAELLLKHKADVDATTRTGATCLMIAVRADDSRLVQLLLGHGADVNASDAAGNTALHVSAYNSCSSAALTLVLNAAEIDAQNEHGLTPLMMAAFRGSLDMMQILLDAGADGLMPEKEGPFPMLCAMLSRNVHKVYLLRRFGVVPDATNAAGLTSLMIAAAVGCTELLDFCLQLGCNVAAKDRENWTALHYAARCGRVDVAKLLLACGAKIDDSGDDNPLKLALRYGQEEFLSVLLHNTLDVQKLQSAGVLPMHYVATLEYGAADFHERIFSQLFAKRFKLNEKDAIGQTPLHRAVDARNITAVKALLNLGAKFRATRKDGWMALHLACVHGDLCIVQMLLEKDKGSVKDFADDGVHALYLAAQHGHAEVLRYLISKKAPVDMATATGTTPLMAAVIWEHLECVHALLDAGASVKAVRNDKRTVLIMAVITGSSDIVRILLIRGADVNRRGDQQRTALYVACNNYQKEIIHLLLNYSADLNCVCDGERTPLMAAIPHGDKALVKLLIDAGASPNGILPAESAMLTPLICAAREAQWGIVQLLIDRGADVNQTNRVGVTALFAAIEANDLIIVETLVSERANLNITSPGGRTAILHAMIHDHVEIVQYLAQAGADVDVADAEGVTALHNALSRGDKDTASLLIRHGADINKRIKGVPLLCIAAEGGHLDCVKLLAGCRGRLLIDAVDTDGNTALYIAAFKGMAAICYVLLEAGADSNIKSNVPPAIAASGLPLFVQAGAAPIHVALQEEHLDVLKILLNSGADPFIKTGDDRTAMHIAVSKGDHEAVRILGSTVPKQPNSLPAETSFELPEVAEPPQPRAPPAQNLISLVPMDIKDLCCPITKDIMEDPVVAADGTTYERSAITEWVRANGTSPITRQPLTSETFLPNLNIRNQIQSDRFDL